MEAIESTLRLLLIFINAENNFGSTFHFLKSTAFYNHFLVEFKLLVRYFAIMMILWSIRYSKIYLEICNNFLFFLYLPIQHITQSNSFPYFKMDYIYLNLFLWESQHCYFRRSKFWNIDLFWLFFQWTTPVKVHWHEAPHPFDKISVWIIISGKPLLTDFTFRWAGFFRHPSNS